MSMQQTKVERGDYGELVGALAAQAMTVVNLAIKTGKLDKPGFTSYGRHRGYALNYDAYDVRGSAVIVQQRETEVTKYGASPCKSYYLVRKCGKGVVVRNLEDFKAGIVKRCKASREPGEVIEHLTRNYAWLR